MHRSFLASARHLAHGGWAVDLLAQSVPARVHFSEVVALGALQVHFAAGVRAELAVVVRRLQYRAVDGRAEAVTQQLRGGVLLSEVRDGKYAGGVDEPAEAGLTAGGLVAEEARGTLYSIVESCDATKVSVARECDALDWSAQGGEDDAGRAWGGPSPCQATGDDIADSHSSMCTHYRLGDAMCTRASCGLVLYRA